MNLPMSVDDQSLLEHEPLRSHIIVSKCAEGSTRSQAENSISRFIEEMQQNEQAAAAAKKWASLVFQGVLSDESSFEVTDGGKELYRAFFEYQCQLYQGQKEGNFNKARQYEAQVLHRGVRRIKLKNHVASTPKRSTSGRGSEASQSQDSRRTTGGKADQAGPAFNDLPLATGVRLSTLSEVPSKRNSTSKKEKKRKPSSQIPSAITPSDASEDDKDPRTVPATNSISHRSKRIASNPHDLLRVKDQVDKTNKQHFKRSADISRRQSSLTRFPSGDFVSHRSIKGRRGAAFPLNGRKHNGKRFSNVSTPSTRRRLNTRRLREIKSDRNLQPRRKRMRRAATSILDGGAGEGPESTQRLGPKFPQKHTIRTLTPSTRKTRIELKTRRKRTRLEFETAFMACDKNASPGFHEVLGPDIRLSRPLPKKVRDVRLAPGICEVPYGAPTLQHADQLLRDAASNALVTLREGVEPDTTDWTQDKEHDAGCDDLAGGDEDEANDVQVATAISVPLKPPVPVPPRIWAHSRQEVCESFEYFRAYHGGVYSKDDIVKGYLLGAYAASRDIFHHGGKLIISHGGGKSESVLDVRRGPKRYQTDQDQEASDKSVRALLKTHKERRPIVLLADDRYALFPYDLTRGNYTYVVLGLYWISHAWAECQSARDGTGRIVRWKFAFQWCEGQGEPWWSPRQVMTNVTSDPPMSIANSGMCLTGDSSCPANTSKDSDSQCEKCQEHSPFVYKQGWMCLNPRCAFFWSINGEEPKQLDYRKEFLSLLPQKFNILPNIIPAKVVETPGGVTTTYAFSKGWHCTHCGRLSCRYMWECWECANCKLKHVVKGRIRSPKEFWHQRPSKGFLHSQIGKDSGILACRLEPIDLGGNKGFTNRLTFILPHGRGKIHLILGTPLSNREADDIFQLYQQQASTTELKLRRYPLRNHRAGEPYQYVGGTGQTVPFCEAPDCVRRALALIKERASLALRTDIPFNEILSAAYMERQKMAFHSDSEKELGPTVASLSLGSAALMHFRPLANMNNVKSRCTYALTLVLRHGDVLIMDGDGVQKYYEHTVIPVNFRIAATARCIGTA